MTLSTCDHNHKHFRKGCLNALCMLFLYMLTLPCRAEKREAVFQLRLASSLLCYSVRLLASIARYLRDAALRNSANVKHKIVSY